MKYSVNQFKLKHIGLISDKVDVSLIMTQVFGYKNTWIDRHIMFRYKIGRIIPIIENILKKDISKVQLSDKCTIRYPKNIDGLSFQCRLEIGNIKGGDTNIGDRIIDIITLACFSTHHQATFNSDSKLFAAFRDYVSNQSLIDMFGLYNDIETKLLNSNELWNGEFLKMKVVDLDYDEANGPAIMGRFNLLESAKKIQRDFQVSYKEAFLTPYGLVQWNNLQSASGVCVEDRMRVIKERKMRMSRKQT